MHVKTMNGPVNLDNIKNGHVEVDSLSGEVTMRSVNGPLVQVVSTSGRINYIGDFGNSGEYRLSTHSGDIEATIPEWTSADVSARSTRGEVHDDIPLQPKNHTWFAIDKGRAFAGTMGKVAVSSTVVLRSFSGKIHLRKRPENKKRKRSEKRIGVNGLLRARLESRVCVAPRLRRTTVGLRRAPSS
jgi:hypothetical protein